MTLPKLFHSIYIDAMKEHYLLICIDELTVGRISLQQIVTKRASLELALFA